MESKYKAALLVILILVVVGIIILTLAVKSVPADASAEVKKNIKSDNNGMYGLGSGLIVSGVIGALFLGNELYTINKHKKIY